MKRFQLLLLLSILISCDTKPDVVEEIKDFGEYWFQGKAEVNSYKLEQARYGEIHQGSAVLIFVTEDFSLAKQVKLDRPENSGQDAVKVMKLNLTKKFNTGIYPYSMMSSVFSPIDRKKHPHTLKVTTSSQEWCGHTFTQLNKTPQGYKAQLHSYFEQEGEQLLDLPNTWVEDEIWNIIRLTPDSLPVGEMDIIPSTMAQRLRHTTLQAEKATATLDTNQGEITYKLDYPSSKRKLAITFKQEFPHRILLWKETYLSGFGADAQELTTTARLDQTMMIDYWTKNKNKDSKLRQKLHLE